MDFNWFTAKVYECDDTSHFHIIPVADLRDHRADPSCWCKPTEDPEDPGIWVHNAMDRREEHERGRMRH